MKKFKTPLVYVFIIGSFSALMYRILSVGKELEAGKNIVAGGTSAQHAWADFLHSLSHNLESPLALLLAQIVIIILAARLFGWLCRKIGQPSVMGEIIAGIVLGPSLIGHFFPAFQAALFPAASLGSLKFLSQIGLVLFMFIVGMELNLKVLKSKAHEAVIISHASIIVPFTLGIGLAYFMYTAFAPAGVQFVSFALFIGIAMSITAFPVLARIVQEREISKTKLGSVVITCAAVDDITAWCILAAVIAVVKAGSITSSVYVILLALAYVLVMIKLVRPFLQKMGQLENIDKPLVAVFLLTLIASCLVTEVIGIHALFGAFMVGAIMPENERFRNIFIEKIEDVAVVLLLPLFFVFSGLRTEIGLLTEPYLWRVTVLIIAVAIAGKFVGSALAAKFVGQNWKDSLTIGALMNTRGLMELVALNIGYDLGLLSPPVFTMMVIMALVTTFMTGPALDIINKVFKTSENETVEAISRVSKYKVLLSFTTADGGRSLVRLAYSLVKKMNGNASLTAMHLAAEEKLNNYSSTVYETEFFIPASDEAKSLNQKIVTFFKVSSDTATNTTSVADKGDYDLLLVDAEPSIFKGNTLGKVLGFTTGFINPDRLLNKVNGKEKLFENSFFDETTRLIIEQSKIPVGVFLDKGFSKVDSVFIPVLDAADGFLIAYAQKLISNSAAQITVVDVEGQIKNTTAIKEEIRLIEQNAPNHIRVLSNTKIDLALTQQHDLCIVSISGWKKLLETQATWLVNIPSVLIIANK